MNKKTEKNDTIKDIADLKELCPQEKDAISFSAYLEKRKCKTIRHCEEPAE